MQKLDLFPLPVFKSSTGDRFKFPAFFNGSHVVISDPIGILNVHHNGCFGKIIPPNNKYRDCLLPNDETEFSQNEAGGEEANKIDKTEQLLHLLLEEAFFLLLLNCLQITDANQTQFDINHAWKLFNLTHKLFTQNYIVYHYYKSKNWIVKPGLKFGGDFLLYKESPERCHSAYVLIVDVAQGDHQQEELQTRRSMAVSHMLGLNRLAEAAGKEVLIARICCPQTKHLSLDDPGCIKDFEIQELLINRVHNKVEIK